ncbi:MAG TPA: protein-L-isoaspartate(D-aspartate) O-methyltransferase [Longimicrobiales bacterium]|nr:protein-L-isoaspartate(D-aspartate) O-methyltransferase [Longimicrobiales bacterium]
MNDRRFERQRRQLIEAIADQGIDDLEVLRAFDLVPRHLFVPESVQHRAYEDAPLPIGFQQTASQPSLQALYLKLLKLQPTDRVLEVGTGSGYQTALLGHLAGHVYSIERIRELSQRARSVIDQLRIPNAALLVGDGTIGWSRYAPYDAILVGAGAPAVPQALIDQLAMGGRMLIPIGTLDEQQLTMVRKTEEGITTEEVARCIFVPLLGKYGWQL